MKNQKDKRQPFTFDAWKIIYAVFCLAMTALVLSMAYQEYVYYINRGF